MFQHKLVRTGTRTHSVASGYQVTISFCKGYMAFTLGKIKILQAGLKKFYLSQQFCNQ